MKPSYIQIKDALEHQIKTGELAVGEKLISETELALKYSVSRETVRSALKAMEREGKLRVRHGVGRFVIRPLESIPSRIDHLSSTSEMILSAGLQEGETQISIHTMPSEEEWSAFLNINIGEPVTVIERIRTADDKPVSYNINIMPEQIVGQIFKINVLKGSLMQFLEDRAGIHIINSKTEIIVPPTSDPFVQKLQVSIDATVILLKQTHYDENNIPILFSYDYFRNDIFKFWVQRTR